ncbi:MAG: hypothetical protein Q8P59_05660, partial [Dehalococcoidia bacterium]|nr:hypothetical protein [Dehalococcoidia bacterium]
LRARQEGSLASLRACLVLPPAVALGAGWWYARNWGLYGDPLGLGFFLTAAGAAKPTLGLGQLLGEAERIWVTLWAMFGWSNVPADPAFYALYGFLILLGGLGLVRLAARKEKHPVALSAPITAVLLLWIATYTALVLQYMRMISGMQGRLLFPALPALAILLATGLATIIPRQWTKRLPAVLGATLFVPALLAPFLYILPAYPRVGLLGQSQVGAIPRQLDVNYGNLVKLLGYRMEDSSLKPGQPLTITLYWQALAAPRKNYTLFLHAFDAWGNTLGQMDVLLGERGYPTAAWRTGDALEETYTLTLEEPKERPSLVRFEAGLYLFPSMERLQALDPQGRPLGTSVPVIKAKAAAPPPQPPLPGRDVSLGNRVHLTGYQGPNTALKGGQTLEGRIWWKALDGPGRDYTVFVQLLGPGGLLAQYDAQPRANSYPTSLWEAGEVVEDFFRLSIPRQAPPGVYRLIAGMYDSSSGERLRSNGDDYILLQEIPLEADLPSK